MGKFYTHTIVLCLFSLFLVKNAVAKPIKPDPILLNEFDEVHFSGENYQSSETVEKFSGEFSGEELFFEKIFIIPTLPDFPTATELDLPPRIPRNYQNSSVCLKVHILILILAFFL